MSKEIKFKLTDNQVKALEKMYEENKKNLNSNIKDFDSFISYTVENAIDTHIQFVSMNEKMIDMFDSTLNSMNSNNFDMNNIDEFINNIFSKNTKNEDEKKDSSSNNKSRTSRIKN